MESPVGVGDWVFSLCPLCFEFERRWPLPGFGVVELDTDPPLVDPFLERVFWPFIMLQLVGEMEIDVIC